MRNHTGFERLNFPNHFTFHLLMPQNREKLFGADIKLIEHEIGEDFIRGTRGDLTLTEGVDNIVQALTMRLKVRKGELAPLGWPSYGSRLYELIGEPNNTRTHVILMAHARNAIEQDARVLEVLKVRTETPRGARNTVRIIMEIQLIDEQKPFNFVFDMNLEGA